MAIPHAEQFERLIRSKGTPEGDALFVDLLRQASQIWEPVVDYTLANQASADASILIDLLGRMMQPRAIPFLIEVFLNSPHASWRRSTAIALGWNRARLGLEPLDQLLATDPDAEVRVEAQRAIQEILRDWPALASQLRNYQPPTGSDSADPASPNRDNEQRKLVRLIPRLLSQKFKAVPLEILENPLNIRVGVLHGMERRIHTTISSLVDCDVLLEGMTEDALHKQFELLYRYGDDDFCQLSARLSTHAREELIRAIIHGIHPGEPVAPLPEAHDGVEALQTLAALLLQEHALGIDMVWDADTLRISIAMTEGTLVPIEPPKGTIASRLRLVAEFLLQGVESTGFLLSGVDGQRGLRLLQSSADDEEPVRLHLKPE